jgi:hypothetical protein
MGWTKLVGYACDDAAPVFLEEEDLKGWVLLKEKSGTVLQMLADSVEGGDILVMDFEKKLSPPSGCDLIDESGALSYSFSLPEETSLYEELLALGLTSALNLNENEHLCLLNAVRNYYATNDIGGPVAISSMLPEKPRELELLKLKLDEMTQVFPSFAPFGDFPNRTHVMLPEATGRYARRAVAYALMARWTISHQGGTIVICNMDDMSPESQTRSLMYPVEAAGAFLRVTKDLGVSVVGGSRRSLPRHVEEAFSVELAERGGIYTLRREGCPRRELFVINHAGKPARRREGLEAEASGMDMRACRLVLEALGRHPNATYASLVSFLRNEAEERSICLALDELIRKGHVQALSVKTGARYLRLTASGRSFARSLEA